MVNKYSPDVNIHNSMKGYFIESRNKNKKILVEDELDDALGLNDNSLDNTDDSTDQPMPDNIPTNNQIDTPIENPPVDTAMDDTETIDITTLVNSQDKIMQSLTDLFDKISALDNKQNELSSVLKNKENEQLMHLDAELQGLKKEIEIRNPTNEEEMWLNSMKMYPYNVKLSDFFKPTDDKTQRFSQTDNIETNSNGLKDVTGGNDKNVEYVLKQGDVNDSTIRRSFDYFG